MARTSSDSDQLRLRKELGFLQWEAIGHFLIDGDYLGLNLEDFRGAIAEYEKAWELLHSPWQRQAGGAEILKGIADFALRSEDVVLAGEVLDGLLPRAAEIESDSLRVVIEKLALLAGNR